ncbi:MAG TPA: hypothetical protein PKE06_26775 [Flavilitoribacter sp.]|nr:hypothetical protein [Flavilitoribacter sp.]HMQ88857.1 hypothetical protein [Flavilitoribacter sp.]
MEARDWEKRAGADAKKAKTKGRKTLRCMIFTDFKSFTGLFKAQNYNKPLKNIVMNGLFFFAQIKKDGKTSFRFAERRNIYFIFQKGQNF